MIAYWMDLLNTNEAYVVREKLMNGRDWDHVLDEHSVGFGQSNKRAWSLMRYQASALKKIMDFSEEHEDEIRTIFCQRFATESQNTEKEGHKT